jgi:hypothetical protein
MDEIIKEPTVMEFIASKVPKGSLKKKRIMREAYRRNFCVSIPTSRAMDIIPPTAKRQRLCTKDLSRDAYMEKSSTDSFSGEDRTRLQIFNKLSSMPVQHKLMDPLSLSDAMHPKNVHVRKQVRWYCEDVLEMVSPGHGKGLYEYISNLEIEYVTQKIQTTLNAFVDNLVTLFLYGKQTSNQRLAFVALCGALTCDELNTSLLNRARHGEAQADLLWNQSARCPIIHRVIKRTKYNTGGT